MRRSLMIFAAAGFVMAGTLSALAAQPAAAAPERTALSKECSAQADQKGLHGKARKRFRSACRRGKTPT